MALQQCEEFVLKMSMSGPVHVRLTHGAILQAGHQEQSSPSELCYRTSLGPHSLNNLQVFALQGKFLQSVPDCKPLVLFTCSGDRNSAQKNPKENKPCKFDAISALAG